MPLTERYPWEVLDNDGLSGDVIDRSSAQISSTYGVPQG